MRRAADQWAKALTDPSGRNRLLFYKPLRLGTLDLGGADPAALRRLLGAKPGTTMPLSRLIGGGPDEGEGSVPDAVRRARAVSRKATENFEERGVNTLFLAQGMATWGPPAGGSSTRRFKAPPSPSPGIPQCRCIPLSNSAAPCATRARAEQRPFRMPTEKSRSGESPSSGAR